jgi:hypothetical protein
LKQDGEERHYQCMTDAPAVPPDFVSYVERRLPLLEGAALRLTGQEAQADRLSREMLTLVALRWGRLTRADVKHELELSATADAYLSKLFQQEADELSYPQAALRLDLPASSRRRAGSAPRMQIAEEAEVIWLRARATIKRRWILGAIGLGTAGLLALCQSRDKSPADGEGEQAASPNALPPGTDRAPASVSALRAVGKLPPQIVVPADTAQPLSTFPLTRALVLITSPPGDTSPILVLGEDGAWRHVDMAPEFAALWLHAGSLAPDGIHAALGTSTSTVVVDLRTGTTQSFAAAGPSYRPVWLTSDHLILAKDQMIDIRTGASVLSPVGPEDVLVPQNPPGVAKDPIARLAQLLSVGDPATAAARTRRWFIAPGSVAGLTSVVLPLHGPIGELIGPWRGQGFVSGGGLMVRACQPTAVPSMAAISSVVAVIKQDNGEIVRAMVTERPSGIRVLGWADERHALLGFVSSRQQQIVSWDVLDGRLSLASTVNSSGVLSLPDLTRVA